MMKDVMWLRKRCSELLEEAESVTAYTPEKPMTAEFWVELNEVYTLGRELTPYPDLLRKAVPDQSPKRDWEHARYCLEAILNVCPALEPIGEIPGDYGT